MNPRGVCITNTTSRAEQAAIAAAIIHDYSHLVTNIPPLLKHISLREYVNPRGVCITNTTSLAEQAAIAAAIIHSHIATDSLTSYKAALTPKPPPPPHQRICPPIHCQSNPPVTIAHSFPQSQIPRRYYRQCIC